MKQIARIAGGGNGNATYSGNEELTPTIVAIFPLLAANCGELLRRHRNGELVNRADGGVGDRAQLDQVERL